MRLTPFAKTFITLVIFAVLAVAANHYLPGGLKGLLRAGEKGPGDAVSPPAAGPAAAAASGAAGGPLAPPAFHLAGSNTIGAKLAPALLVAWFQHQGLNAVVQPVGQDETVVRADDRSVLISAHGTKTGFESLGAHQCDIAMASRPIGPAEAAALAPLGVMTAAGRENVIALDGVAVIVNPANPLRSIERGQLADIFSGRSRQWSAVGGSGGEIHLYERDQNSGTTDTFKDRVLRGDSLAPATGAFESNAEVAERVAGDPDGIGYVSFSETGQAKVLAVNERGTSPIRPNRLTVGKEEYLLSRRLYFYTPASLQGAAADFMRFVVSDAGQRVVDQVGFVGQTVAPVAAAPAAELAGVPAEYRAFITGAQTLPFSFRFRSNSAELDTKGVQDLQRLVSYYQAHGSTQILLFGFADGSGAAATNQRLSQQRADSVAGELRAEGLEPAVVRGFGATLFVDSNETAEGRARNRRVEVWVR